MASLIRGTKLSVFDRGFDTKVPCRSDRPVKKAQFKHPASKNCLDWRYRAALDAVNRRQPLPAPSDRWAKMMVYYLAELLHKRTSRPSAYRSIKAAHKLYMARVPTTYRMDALILTGESDITIAAILHTSRHTVRAYRKIFCDTDSVSRMLLQGVYAYLSGPLDQFERWKYAALKGGLEGLFELWEFESESQGMETPPERKVATTAPTPTDTLGPQAV